MFGVFSPNFERWRIPEELFLAPVIELVKEMFLIGCWRLISSVSRQCGRDGNAGNEQYECDMAHQHLVIVL